MKKADTAKRYILIVRQEVNGKVWSCHEKVIVDVALDWVEKPLEWVNDVLVPELPKDIPTWDDRFRYVALEMDFQMLKASGAVMPDRTWECRIDPYPYTNRYKDKWTY